MRKSLITFTLLLVLAAVVTGAAAAQDTIKGAGHLAAEGDGMVIVEGEGWVRVSGKGVLFIADRAGDAEIRISEDIRPTESVRDGHKVLVYRGFDGEAYVRGSHIVVGLRGKDIKLEAEGVGRARLRGKWTYIINGEEGKWTEEGVTVNLGTPPSAGTE